jgi:uncharacterized protein (UPF0335 family)
MSDAKIDQEKLVAFAEMIEEVLNRKKDIAQEEKEMYEGFISEHSGLKKKPLKAAVKKYLAWKKDQTKFNEEEFEETLLLDALTGEKTVPETAGDAA